MKKIIEFIKDKIYYISAITVLLIVILIIISACSNNVGGSYSSIESKMINAAKNYYNERQEKLPKEDGGSVKVTIGTLIDAELIKEIKDPNNKEQTCDGFVQVKKVEDNYVYIPFLTCKGNYEPQYLTDAIKESKQDEYGNGVYEMDGEYVYRGDDVNNYVTFNNQTWRIMRLNSDNEIKIILNNRTEEEYTWETSYNINKKESVGITDNYLNTNIRKSLLKYYNENFTQESKSLILSKTWCIGGLTIGEDFNKEKECSKIKEEEHVGLMNISDYLYATLDPNCTNPYQAQCTNRNYLVSTAYISTWTMNTVLENNYQVYKFISGNIVTSSAADSHYINPVVYLSSDTIISGGNGTNQTPYIVK